MNAVIRADRSPAVSMAFVLLGAILNITLDKVIYFILKWGIAGAVWATVIGQTVSFIVRTLYLFRTKNFYLKKAYFIPQFKIFSNGLKLGTYSLITQMSVVVIFLVCILCL